MARVYVYHGGRRGEVLLARTLVAAIAAGGTEVVVGTCRGDGELMAGLGPRVQVVEGPLANTPWGAPLDLAVLRPAGLPCLELWSGREPTVPTWQWHDLLDGLRAQCRRLGLHLPLPDGGEVPMLDFAPADVVVPAPRRPAIWLDVARTVEPACWFSWDLPRLMRALPDHELWCTAPLSPGLPNLIDVSALTWPQRSRASEACVALAGTTLDPFVVTMTTANRWKPKALCGYDARVHGPFWDYPGNPLEVLGTMDDLIDFLLANVAAEVRS